MKRDEGLKVKTKTNKNKTKQKKSRKSFKKTDLFLNSIFTSGAREMRIEIRLIIKNIFCPSFLLNFSNIYRI